MLVPTPVQAVLRVAVDAPIRHSLNYLAPTESPIAPGTRVRVRLGRRLVAGLVLGTATEADMASISVPLKPIEAVLESQPSLPLDVVAMVEFAARYYWAPPGALARAALPPGLQSQPGKRFALSPLAKDLRKQGAMPTVEADDQALLQFLAAGPRSRSQILRGGWSLEQTHNLVRQGWVDADPDRQPQQTRLQNLYQLSHPLPEKPLPTQAKRMRAVVDRLATGEALAAADVEREIKGAREALRRLLALGWVQKLQQEQALPELEQLRQDWPGAPDRQDQPPPLTAAQQSAVDTINQALRDHSGERFLLHGVTASGKTEVYIAAAQQALRQNQGVLVLVPEIALTPQLVGRFQNRLDGPIEVLHSGLSEGDRRRRWQRIRQGQARCVIGARSAVFAPIENLRFIVVDEEHDASYKQDESPRYNARDLALWRSQWLEAVTVLGSATPSLESYKRAQDGALKLLTLPDRVTQAPLPQVELLPLTPQISPRAISPSAEDIEILTPPLVDAMTQSLNRGQQVILFLNRRGFANFVICADCGEIVGCPNCSVSLTHHRVDANLRCHYCDYQVPIPDHCERCQSARLIPFGLGTERLEEAVKQRFPTATVARLDRDSTRRKGALLSTLRKFGEHKIDVLVGTQMLAKGHDFPDVTLVGVIVADTGLGIADFRAAERTFQVLAQVSGRAGRGQHPGRVMIQAFDLGNPVFAAAQEHDFCGFAEAELDLRQLLQYPPFGRLAVVRLEARDANVAMREARQILNRVRKHCPKAVDLLGPAPAPLAKLRGLSRVQILVKAPSVTTMQNCLAQLWSAFDQLSPKSSRLVFDVDPTLVL